jgi:hypothetical protein
MWVLGVGILFVAGGLWLWSVGDGAALLIVGVVALITGLFEPLYGQTRRVQPGGDWRATDERFVEPDTGELVVVWFNPATGERRYVAAPEGEAPRQRG